MPRRYALFALVGITAEDDLDAPLRQPSPPVTTATGPGAQNSRKSSNGSIHKRSKPVLAAEASAALRDQLMAEIHELKDDDELALWAHRRLPAKNTLTANDARAVEATYQGMLNLDGWLLADARTVLPSANDSRPPSRPLSGHPDTKNDREDDAGRSSVRPQPTTDRSDQAAAIPTGSTTDQQPLVAPFRKTVRKRNKVHLAFVATQPCLVCRRSPCDAHHLKFAQPRSLGRKVSDEFTVPLCRDHHQQLHRKAMRWRGGPTFKLRRSKWRSSYGKPRCFKCIAQLRSQTGLAKLGP
jgi:hypothetical protein